MKKGSTLFLKIALLILAIPVVALAIFGLYWLSQNPANPDYVYMLYPIVIGIYVTVIPFLIALVQAYKLLSFIDHNEAFSQQSVQALMKIKYCAISISAVYAIILPFVFMLAEMDDAPGLVFVGAAPIFASLVVAVFAAVLQKLLHEAIDYKNENELTV